MLPPTNLNLNEFKIKTPQASVSTTTPTKTTAPIDLSQYKMPAPPVENKNNIFQNVVGGVLKSVIAKPARRMVGALGLLGTTFASPETQRRAEEFANRDEVIDFGPIGGKQTIEGAPDITTKEGRTKVAGETLENAVNLVPSGVVEGAVAKTLGKTGIEALVPKFANFLKKTSPLPAYGYGSDVAQNLEEGNRDFSPGAGTAVTSGIAGIPILGKALARGAGEIGGVSTGVGYGVLKEAFDASRAGGERLKAFKENLRTKGGEESIVEEARDALATMRQARSDTYKTNMGEVYKAPPVDPKQAKTILDSVRQGLDDFKVVVGKDGQLDFSRSALRFNREGQADIANIYKTLADFGKKPEDFSVESLDNLKQALGDLYSPSGKARAFVQKVKKATRDVLGKTPGYNEMAGAYEKSTDLIDDVSRGLSLGDKVQTDTAFRKLTSALRTNNEIRKEFIEQLNEASDGYISSKIAGQQLSEFMPRGLARIVEPLTGAYALSSGIALAKILPAMAATSPRLVGEFVSLLGRAAGGVDNALEALRRAGVSVPKTPGDLFNQKAQPVLPKNITSPETNVISKTTPAENLKIDSSSIPETIPPKNNTSMKGFIEPKVAAGTALGALGVLSQVKGKESYTRTAETTPEINADKIGEAIAYNETRGEKTPYSFSKYSGSSVQGDALGKYQVTEGELKTYGMRYLGEVPSKEEFLESPEMQDEYMQNKINYLLEDGMSLDEIFATHRGGIKNPKEKVKKYAQYVKDASDYYNKED